MKGRAAVGRLGGGRGGWRFDEGADVVDGGGIVLGGCGRRDGEGLGLRG